MIFAALLAWLGPMLIGLAVGLWIARRPASSPKEFGVAMVLSALCTAIGVFAIHMVWLGAFMINDGGIRALGSWAWYWTLITAMVWLPIMVIAYILRARRELRR